MKRKLIVFSILIVILISLILIIFFYFNNYYLILTGKEKQINIPIKENDKFIISFKHSVALTYVYEYYTVYNNKIILYETHFYDQCAGLPTETNNGEKFIMEIGIFKITNMKREFEFINYRINIDLEFKLVIKNKELNLSDIFGTEKVIISLRRRLWPMKMPMKI